MAIAITLLALDLQVPEVPAALAAHELPARLGEMLQLFLSFVIGFVVVGIFWISHHRLFGYIERYDNSLLWLNLLYLIFIVFFPFATRLLGIYGTLPFVNALYALTGAGCSLALTWIWHYASTQHRLIDRDLDPRLVRSMLLRPAITAVVFMLSIPAAYYNVVLAQCMWWSSILVSAWVSRYVWPTDRSPIGMKE